MTNAFEAAFDALTLEEKIALVSGIDMWHTAAIERLGIPSLWMSDGPNGVRGIQFAGSATSACFPCGSALGATFDAELVGELGIALGREAAKMGVHVLLGPTINTVRLPIAGRNFECFSEDPHLSSILAVAYVEGVQSNGVAAVVKHFVCNDSDRDRYTTSSDVDERALREIYLPAFHAAVTKAGVWGVMSGYNKVNGRYACESSELLHELLKGEWAFSGPVMSDWYGTTSTVDAAFGGLDLEMPGPPMRWGDKLLAAVEGGEVPTEFIDDKVRRILRLIERTTAPKAAPDPTPPAPLIRRVAAEATVLLKNDGGLLPLDPATVGTLAVIGPNAASVQAHGGGSARVHSPYVVSPLEALRDRCGDAVVHEPGCSIQRGIPVLNARRLVADDGAAPITVEYFDNLDLAGEPHTVERAPAFQFTWNGPPVPGLEPGRYSARLSATFLPEESGTAHFALSGVGRMRLSIDGTEVIENWDDPVIAPVLFGRGAGQVVAPVELVEGTPVDLVVTFQAPDAETGARALALSPVPPTEAENRTQGPSSVTLGYRPPTPADLELRAEQLAARADTVVVVVGTNEDWESEGFDREGLALPAGQDELIARLAKVHPNLIVAVNTGSPIEMPWANDVGAILQLWLAGQEAGNALTDVLFGDVNPSARLPVTIPERLEDSGGAANYPAVDGRLVYGEGIYAGYRHFDAEEITPRFCFGHGLSYTSFTYGAVQVVADVAGFVEASVEVTNTGDRAGAEVVQFYVGDIECSLDRPVRELKGVKKLRLAPGETKIARVPLGGTTFAFWDPELHDWRIEGGEFEIAVGASSRDLRSTTIVQIGDDGRLD